jgi:hypothetical protein
MELYLQLQDLPPGVDVAHPSTPKQLDLRTPSKFPRTGCRPQPLIAAQTQSRSLSSDAFMTICGRPRLHRTSHVYASSPPTHTIQHIATIERCSGSIPQHYRHPKDCASWEIHNLRSDSHPRTLPRYMGHVQHKSICLPLTAHLPSLNRLDTALLYAPT